MASVQDPGIILRVNDNGLRANEVIFVVGTCGRVRSVVDGSARGRVDSDAGPGTLSVVRE